MKQTTVVKTEIQCGDKQFRNCVADSEKHVCVNCGYSFGEDVKVGEKYIGECKCCDVEKEVTCESHGISYNKATGKHDGENHPYGTCEDCIANWKAIDESGIYERFRGGYYGYETKVDEDGDVVCNYDNFTNERFVEAQEDDLEAFEKLTPEQRKSFLRSIYNAIER